MEEKPYHESCIDFLYTAKKRGSAYVFNLTVRGGHLEFIRKTSIDKNHLPWVIAGLRSFVRELVVSAAMTAEVSKAFENTIDVLTKRLK